MSIMCRLSGQVEGRGIAPTGITDSDMSERLPSLPGSGESHTDLRTETPTSWTIGIIMREGHMEPYKKAVHAGRVAEGNVSGTLDVTITDFAERIGISRKTVSALVNGRAPVTMDIPCACPWP